MDKDHDQNNLNMKNSGGYQGPSAAWVPAIVGGFHTKYTKV